MNYCRIHKQEYDLYCVYCGKPEIKKDIDTSPSQGDVAGLKDKMVKKLYGDQPCIWDSIPEKDRGKPMGISCHCPKCTPSILGEQ